MVPNKLVASHFGSWIVGTILLLWCQPIPSWQPRWWFLVSFPRHKIVGIRFPSLRHVSSIRQSTVHPTIALPHSLEILRVRTLWWFELYASHLSEFRIYLYSGGWWTNLNRKSSKLNESHCFIGAACLGESYLVFVTQLLRDVLHTFWTRDQERAIISGTCLARAIWGIRRICTKPYEVRSRARNKHASFLLSVRGTECLNT